MSSSRRIVKPGDDPKPLYAFIVIGTLLRLLHLGGQSIWGDESLTVLKYAVGDNLRELLTNVWQQGFHPPVYFIAVNYWYRLGESEFMLRFPSMVFGVAAIPVVYLLARRLFGRTAALASAGVVALSPFHVWYSQEARMYSLMVLFAAASMLFFVRASESRRAVDYVLYALVTVLGLFTHMAFLLLVAAQGLFVLGSAVQDWRRNIGWVGVQALVVLIFTPWIVRFMIGRSGGGLPTVGFQRDASPLHLAYGLYALCVGYTLGPTVSSLHYAPAGETIRQYLPVIVVSALAFGVLGILGLVESYKSNRLGFWILCTHLAVPVGLTFAASVLPQLPLNPRYLMVAVVPLWVIISLGVVRCARRKALYAVPAMGLVLVGLSLGHHYFDPVYAKEDMRSAVSLVVREASPDDVILISSVELGGPFIYYFGRRDVEYVGYPPGVGYVDPKALGPDMERIISGKRRAWLVLGRTWSSDPEGMIPEYFEARYRLSHGKDCNGVVVRCFDLHP